MVRRVEVEADNLGGLGDKVRIVALTPGLARRKIDLVRAQEAPDVLIRHIAQLARQQRCRPTAVARRRRLIEQRQDALAGIGSVTRSWSGPRQVVQPGQAVARKTRPPAAHPARPSVQFGRYRAGRTALCREQHDAGPFDKHMLSLRRSDHGLKRRSFLRRQLDRRRFLDVHSILASRLRLQR